MSIDWKAPFELAFELGLFLIGSILTVFVVFAALILLFGLVRAFFTAMRTAKSRENEKKMFKSKS
jgi:uncharacterized membrane protein